MLGFFLEGELKTKSIYDEGPLSREHLKIGKNLQELILKKVFGEFYKVDHALGIHFLQNRTEIANQKVAVTANEDIQKLAMNTMV